MRLLQFSADGRLLLTGADDKTVRLWACNLQPRDPVSSTAAWHCVAAWRTPKKASAGAFNVDGSEALFADKFGDVLVGKIPAGAAAGSEVEGGVDGEPALQVPATLLGHFCTIVTGLAPSPCGRFLATSDREYKVGFNKHGCIECMNMNCIIGIIE